MGTDVDEIFDEELADELLTDGENLFDDIEFEDDNPDNSDTPYAAHELIRAIYIGAPDKSSGKRRQSIQICYDLVGFIPLDELMKQETA